jgi:hypothetical protein
MHFLDFKPLPKRPGAGAGTPEVETGRSPDRQSSDPLLALHRAADEEVRHMAKKSRGGFNPTLEPIIETMGLKWVIEQVGARRLAEEFGLRRLVEEFGVRRLVEELGTDALLAQMTPEQRRQLKESLG